MTHQTSTSKEEFESLLSKAIKPEQSVLETENQTDDGDYSATKTHPHTAEDTSETPSGTSHPESVSTETKTPQ